MFSWTENHWSRIISRLLAWMIRELMVPFTRIKCKLKEKMLLSTEHLGFLRILLAFACFKF